MAVVEVRNLFKMFGDVCACNGVSLTIQEGEFLVLLGPSGSGKTTLMRMIAGLEKPSEGEIFIGGKDVTHLPPHARKIAMVFQSYALYPHMTVFHNIAFPLRAAKTPPHLIHERVERAAKMFNIGHLLARKPRQLSGGERQRVAIARAVVREPDVFLLDEPLSNLDAKLRATSRDELKTFQRQLGVTTIYVTHDQVEAMGMGDRVVVMNAGQIYQIGTPHELYHAPANTFVATFLGSPPMNLIEQANVVIGFHPEHFIPREVADQHIPGEEVFDPVTIPFHVTRVEYLGSERFIYGTVASTSGMKRVVASLPSLVRNPVEAGSTYPFVVDRNHLSYFDKQTGTRVQPVAFAMAEVS